MILTRGDVKAIVVEAFEILVECEDVWEQQELTPEQMRALIRARMKEWKEREL